jgi:DNA/RNA-binding domain of Phe-tRNA-synthetase-like protein
MSVTPIALFALLTAYGLAELVSMWRDRRRARLQELARESWAIYHAARQIHDEASLALRTLLEEARARRQP